MYITDFPVLNEAEITHGGSVGIGFNALPKDLQDKIKEKLKARGKSEDEIKSITMKYTAVALDNQFREKEVSIDGFDIIDGMIHHQLEVYDKTRDLALLQAEDIVKAYREAAGASYDKAVQFLNENANEINKRAARGADVVSEFFHKNEFDNLTRLLTSSSDALFELQERYDFSEAELKRSIVENAFSDSDDPNKIRDIIQARITYSNVIVQMFKQMLQQNYKILGITEREASLLAERISSGDADEEKAGIVAIKDIIENKAEQFHKKDMYDLRPIGGGCIFYTSKDLGAIVKADTTFRRLIQLAMTHDAIIVAHGSNKTKAGIAEKVLSTQIIAPNFKKTYQKAKLNAITQMGISFGKSDAEQYQDYVRASKKAKWSAEKLAEFQNTVVSAQKALKAAIDAGDESLIQSIISANENVNQKFKKIAETSEKAIAEYKEMEDQIKRGERVVLSEWKAAFEAINSADDAINKALDKYNEVLRKYKDSTYWGCQPVKTLKGGPFTDMNKLVAQLIKEGFKNIYIMSCNPGSHELDPKILATPGVKIHHAVHSILSENVEYVYDTDDSFNEAYNTIDEATTELEVYESMYNTASNEFSSEFLTEAGSVSSIWAKVKEWIRTAIKKVINFFKTVFEKIKNFIDHVKNFFKNRKGKLTKKVDTGVIRGDGKVEKFNFDDYEELKKKTEIACDELTKMIHKYEQESIKGMQEAEKYADQQSKKAVNESIDGMDTLVNMLW